MGKLLQIHTLSFFHPTLAREDVFSTEPMRGPAISEYAASHTLSDVTPGAWTPGDRYIGVRVKLGHGQAVKGQSSLVKRIKVKWQRSLFEVKGQNSKVVGQEVKCHWSRGQMSWYLGQMM